MTSQIDRFKTGKLIKSVMDEKGIRAVLEVSSFFLGYNIGRRSI